MKRMKLSVVLLLAFASIATILGASIVQKRIPSSGTVHITTLGIDAFWDEACTNAITTIDWGTRGPGDTASKVLYVENTGNTAVVLSLMAENWVPATAESFISVAWDAEDSTLSASAVKAVTLTMTIATNISGVASFTLDIVLTGDET